MLETFITYLPFNVWSQHWHKPQNPWYPTMNFDLLMLSSFLSINPLYAWRKLQVLHCLNCIVENESNNLQDNPTLQHLVTYFYLWIVFCHAMSSTYLTFQSPSDFVVIYDFNIHESSYPPSSTMFPFQLPLYAPQKFVKHQK
jgi:hypothetical protein